jgi:hypothetical protein
MIMNFAVRYLIRRGPHRKKLFHCFECIHCRGNVFIESLPSNDRGMHRQTESKVIS